MPNDYPANWPEIAKRIKDDHNWRCEHCGHIHDQATGHVLTVHHLDGDKSNCSDENLVALCQRCHLHIQAVYVVGQISLIPYSWAVARGLM